MITRYGTSIGFGAAVTFGLLLLMQLLIATDARFGERIVVPRLEFVRIERSHEPETRRTLPERPDPATPPPDSTLTPADPDGPILIGRGVTPVAPRQFDLPRGPGQLDGDLLSLVKVTPTYPARALTQELEGYVVVEFTVTRLGLVEDVVVAEASHRVFERAAVEAAYKFKYKPRVIDGEPIEVRGVQNKITFTLGD